jgi:hypothetical protein
MLLQTKVGIPEHHRLKKKESPDIAPAFKG